MELGARNHNKDGLLEPNSIMVVNMDPLGLGVRTPKEGTKRFETWSPENACNTRQTVNKVRDLLYTLNICSKTLEPKP